MVLGLDPNVFVAVVAPTLLLFFTQLGTLIWFLASMRMRSLALMERIQRIDGHTEEHCEELKKCNERLVRLETQVEYHGRAAREWRDLLETRLTRLEAAGDDD